MPLPEPLSNLISASAPQRTLAHIAADDCPPLAASEGYVRIWLEQMRLSEGRRLWSKRYPLVHAFTSLDAPGAARTAPYVADPGPLTTVSSSGLDRVVASSHVIFGPVPYLGGRLEIAVGLFSLAADRGVEGAIRLMAALSPLVIGPGASILSDVAQPLGRTIEHLLGTEDARLQLGLRSTYATGTDQSPAIRSGWIAVVDAPSASVDAAALSVVDRQLCLKTGGSVSVVDDHDLILLRVETLDQLDDWRLLESLDRLWTQITAAMLGDGQDVGRAVSAFAQAVVSSRDLIDRDRIRLVAGARRHIDASRHRSDASNTGGPFRAPASIADVVAHGPSIDDARRLSLREEVHALTSW
jgi:hypothetical protein